MIPAAPGLALSGERGEAFLDALRRFAFLDLEPTASTALAAAAAPPPHWTSSARVAIPGAHPCALTLLAAPEFAARAARNYTAVDGEPAAPLCDDTLRELANIAAGTLYDLLSGGERPAGIAPPVACADPAAAWAALPPAQRWVLDCDGQPALVILAELPAAWTAGLSGSTGGPPARTGGPGA